MCAALPKSASFRDLLAQYDAAEDIWWAPPPPTPISCANPLWFQCRFGLARTNGLRQNAIVEIPFPPPGLSRVRRFDGAGAGEGFCFHGEDSAENPESVRSFASSVKLSGAGDNPRFVCRHRRLSAPPWWWRRAWSIAENHDGGDADEDGSSQGAVSVLFDLPRKRLERIPNLPADLLLVDAGVTPSYAAAQTCGVPWNIRSCFRRATYGDTE